MVKRSTKRILLLVIFCLLSQVAFVPEIRKVESGIKVVEQVQSLIPVSVEMVDNAIYVVSKGWNGMTQYEKSLFIQLFDPGDTGDVDQEFVTDVLANLQQIRGRLSSPLMVAYRENNDRCEGKRLFYTDLHKIFVCPYFTTEESNGRKARVLIHEIVHMALLSVDRPYFHKNTHSTRYQALTPRGSWTAEIPLLGPIFREIARGDTLYHPDAYAWLAVELADA